jgi:pimeloyl-ACP methyl ester carboxylesterase
VQHLQRFYTKKEDEGLAPATIIYYHSVLHNALDTAVKRGLVARNVCDLASPPHRKRFEIHILNVVELSDALASWMQTMKLPSATFLGNSMGCQVIVNFALRYPQCIERAILVSPTMDPNALTIHQEAGRLLRDTPCEPLHFLPVLLREYVRAGIPRTIRTLQYALEDPMEEHLSHVHIPTLVIRGSRDPIVSQDWVEKVNRLLPDSQLVVVQGAGHAVNFNSPDRLVHLVRSFLQDTDR